jgi:hypothetical protein
MYFTDYCKYDVFEVLKSLSIKSTLFWDVKQSSSVEIRLRFR